MGQSQRCVTESMFHSSDEKIVESSHSFTHTTKKKQKVAPNIPKKKDEEKEGEMEYLMDVSQRKRSRGVAV